MDILIRPERELSQQVIRIARAIDRLPPGDYRIELHRTPNKAETEARITGENFIQIIPPLTSGA